MKISHKDLKELYKSYLEDKIPGSRAKCPLPEGITACLRGESSKKRKNQIIDHIFHCVYCNEEFEFALETIREERKFIQNLDAIMQKKKNKKEYNFFQFFLFRPTWLNSLILIIGIVLVTLLVKNIAEDHKFRGAESKSVMLIAPNKKTTLQAQIEFEWKDVQNSDYYILEIFDESLFPIWKSSEITANHTLLPKEISNRFFEHKTYYWMVTAYLSDGKTIESRLLDFVISD
jgi:hypothetical protein